MAEAVAALSLAANILQMVEYGFEFVNVSWKIWSSGKDGIEGLTSLQILSRDLNGVLNQLQADTPSTHKAESESNSGIFELAGECSKVTQQMVDSLEKVGVPGKGRKHEAIKAAFKLTWNSEKIKALQARLHEADAMKSLEKQDMILQNLSKFHADNKELQAKIDQMSHQDEGFGSRVVGYLVHRMGPSHSVDLEESLRAALFGAVYESAKQSDGGDGLDFGISERRKGILQKKFLSKLRYDTMHDREHMVAEAHKSTFRWIFEAEDKDQSRAWANFRRWLESDQQLYWITGKPGSGKSTLLKFISQPVHETSYEPRCMEYLRQWAGDQPLLVASFYFWAAGLKTQTSKDGLFRTLLNQILDRYPETIPRVSPERWEALCLFNEDPRLLTEEELRSILYRTVTCISSTTKLCLFVDGLDEFDGEHDDLIELFKHLIESSSVKVCVASRPWVVFEDALKNKPSLRLQDLTYTDINEYVSSRFRADSNFALLQKRETVFADQLIEEVVRKAAGVFLWVNLVVSSLLNGMKYGDRVSDLRRRLDRLPPDLEDLYDRILNDLDPFYFEHAVQYFQLMSACPQPPSTLLLSFADEDKPDFALQLAINPLSAGDIELRRETMRRRLNSRCKGLIEVVGEPWPTDDGEPRFVAAQYLHKTVKNYVESSDVQKRLLNGLKTPFDPHLRLCSGNLASYKAFTGNSRHESRSQIFLCMWHASRVSIANVPDMIRILDELERSIAVTSHRYVDELVLGRIHQDCRSEFEDLPDKTVTKFESFGNTFLSLAVKCEVIEFIKAKAGPGCLVPTGDKYHPSNTLAYHERQARLSWSRIKAFTSRISNGSRNTTRTRPLLCDAVPSTSSNATMVSTLLQKGADPNHEKDYDSNTSIWVQTLAVIMGVFSTTSWDPERKKVWEEIAQLMVTHGADINRRSIEAALDIVTDNFSLNGLEAKEMVDMWQNALRRMKQGGARLDFTRDYDLKLSKPLLLK